MLILNKLSLDSLTNSQRLLTSLSRSRGSPLPLASSHRLGKADPTNPGRPTSADLRVTLTSSRRLRSQGLRHITQMTGARSQRPQGYDVYPTISFCASQDMKQQKAEQQQRVSPHKSKRMVQIRSKISGPPSKGPRRTAFEFGA